VCFACPSVCPSLGAIPAPNSQTIYGRKLEIDVNVPEGSYN